MDNVKHFSICIMRVPNRKERKGQKKIFEDIVAPSHPRFSGKYNLQRVQKME